MHRYNGTTHNAMQAGLELKMHALINQVRGDDMVAGDQLGTQCLHYHCGPPGNFSDQCMISTRKTKTQKKTAKEIVRLIPMINPNLGNQHSTSPPLLQQSPDSELGSVDTILHRQYYPYRSSK